MPQSMGLQRGRHYLATEQQFPTPQSPRTWWTKLEEKAAVESEGEGGRGLQSWLAPRPQADIRETRLGRQDGQVGTITPCGREGPRLPPPRATGQTHRQAWQSLTQPHCRLHTFQGSFPATTAELSSCNRGCRACKAGNIYRKSCQPRLREKSTVAASRTTSGHFIRDG